VLNGKKKKGRYLKKKSVLFDEGRRVILLEEKYKYTISIILVFKIIFNKKIKSK
jgi:hypothetical protein